MFVFKDVKYKDIIDISHLSIKKGLVTSFIGSSGSGKTTVLRMLNKLISPTEGEIYYNSTSLEQADTIAHRRQVVMLSQTPVIFDQSVRYNLNIGLRFHDKADVTDKKLMEMLNNVNLKKSLDENVVNFSGGEKQRLALARVMLLNPSVYLLDEPSSALDDQTEDLLINMLTQHVSENGKTIIMATHSKSIAKKYSNEIIYIECGKIINRS